MAWPICLEKNYPFFRQLAAFIGVLLTVTCGGYVAGFTTIAVAQFRSDNDGIPLTSNQETWFAILGFAPMMPTCLVTGWIVERYGRRTALIASEINTIIAWIIIATSQNYTSLIVGRIFNGIADGIGCTVIPIFLGEVIEPKLRFIFLTAPSIGIALGPFICHIGGYFLHWRAVAYIGIIPPLIAMIILSNLNDSYMWYANRKQNERAKSIFYYYRGCTPNSSKELGEVFEAANFNVRSSIDTKFFKQFGIVLVFMLCLQFTCNKVLMVYSLEIIQTIIKDSNEYSMMLLMDLIRLILTVVGLYVTRHYRVRTLTLISGLGTSFAMVLLAILLYYINYNQVMTICALVALLLVLAFPYFGFAFLPWIVTGEIFPRNCRELGGGLATLIYTSGYFIVLWLTPFLMQTVGMSYTFAFYASCMLIGTVILGFVAPETRNKTLGEIELDIN